MKLLIELNRYWIHEFQNGESHVVFYVWTDWPVNSIEVKIGVMKRSSNYFYYYTLWLIHKPSLGPRSGWPRAVSSAGPGCCGLPATLKADSPRNNATASIYLATRPSSVVLAAARCPSTHYTQDSVCGKSPFYRTIESGLRSVVGVSLAQLCRLHWRRSMGAYPVFSFSQQPVSLNSQRVVFVRG